MPRNLIRPILCDAEPMLGEVSREVVRRKWLPGIALQAPALDTSRWQTRGARGFSWYPRGKCADRRSAH
jgi:hypothetical protein